MGLGALSFDLFYDDVDESAVTDVVQACIDQGCHTDRDGGTDRHHYIGATSDYDPEWVPTDEAIETLASVGGVTLFWLDDFDFNVRIDPTGVEYEVPLVSIWLDEVFYRPSRSSEATVEARVEALLDVVCAVADRTGPVGGYGYVDEIVGREGGAYEGIPREQLRSGSAGIVHWFTLVPDDEVEALGRERVLDAPAWQVRELSTDDVAIVASAQPIYGGGDQRQAIADHLEFEGPAERQILEPSERHSSDAE